jgi:hypothetical protein
MATKANPYYNFMENTCGLGRNGTHLVHAGAVGGATFALGKYGDIGVISSNWWAPFVGAFGGLGLSMTVRYLLVGGNDEKSVEMALEHLRSDLKGRKLTKNQIMRLQKLIPAFKDAGRQNEIENEERELDDLAQALG